MCFTINFSNKSIGHIKEQGNVSRRTNRSNGREEGGSGEDGGVANIYNIRVYKDFKLKVNSNAYHFK